eukprot:scaffold46181_cov29-Prasinocladus_malaysianus.AAC.1
MLAAMMAVGKPEAGVKREPYPYFYERRPGSDGYPYPGTTWPRSVGDRVIYEYRYRRYEVRIPTIS